MVKGRDQNSGLGQFGTARFETRDKFGIIWYGQEVVKIGKSLAVNGSQIR